MRKGHVGRRAMGGDDNAEVMTEGYTVSDSGNGPSTHASVCTTGNWLGNHYLPAPAPYIHTDTHSHTQTGRCT
jgi:hypothetical protein